MPDSIAVTLIGPDRPGIIERVASTAAAHGANWLDSRMANLAGQFAGIVHLEVAPGAAEALEAALVALQRDGLRITVVASGSEAPAVGLPPDARALELEITGHDHPGIVRDIAHALAARGVSIESLETRQEHASWSGETLFRAVAALRVPADVELDELQRTIEALSDEIMVDAALGERSAGSVATADPHP